MSAWRVWHEWWFPGIRITSLERGNRRLPTFFSEEDYRMYLALIQERCAESGVAVWAWCLMPNHVHRVAVPKTAEGLAAAIGRAHRRYTRAVNFREKWRGYLWQGRFSWCPMDAAPTLAAARYVERNPVRAGLVEQPWQWPWSSAAAPMEGRGDRLVASGGPPGRPVGRRGASAGTHSVSP